LFLDNGADVNQRMVEGWSALHIAAGEGFTEIVELILGQKTTNVNIASDGADTPLHKAAERGHDEIVRLLLGKGADVNARNGKGRTPLTVAKRNGRKATMELLRTRGGVE
jgi:ankyrin repeat protein